MLERSGEYLEEGFPGLLLMVIDRYQDRLGDDPPNSEIIAATSTLSRKRAERDGDIAISER